MAKYAIRYLNEGLFDKFKNKKKDKKELEKKEKEEPKTRKMTADDYKLKKKEEEYKRMALDDHRNRRVNGSQLTGMKYQTKQYLATSKPQTQKQRDYDTDIRDKTARKFKRAAEQNKKANYNYDALSAGLAHDAISRHYRRHPQAESVIINFVE